MKYLRRPAKNAARQLTVAPTAPLPRFPEPESEPMRRNLSVLRIACESFAPIPVARVVSESDGDRAALADGDRGRVWVYLPTLPQEGESDEIRFLASALAGQFGLVASVIVETSSVTVILERRVNA